MLNFIKVLELKSLFGLGCVLSGPTFDGSVTRARQTGKERKINPTQLILMTF